MSKQVATKEEVSAIASSATTDLAGNTGAFTAGPSPLHVTTASKLEIEGGPVALDASQTFTFSGKNPSNSPITYTSPVTLRPGPTKLRAAGQSVLVDHDTADDANAGLVTPANEISVSSSRKVRTS